MSSSSVELKLDWCSVDAARYAVEHWHYSRCLPMPPWVRVGVWEARAFIGCVLFSRGAAKRLLSPYGLTQTEGCELTRIALTTHATPVSRILAIAVRLMHTQNPGLRLIVSFADTAQAHHGGVYQAAGWIYTGLTARSPEWVDDVTGKHYHPRVVARSGVVKQFGVVMRSRSTDGLRRSIAPGKHRYLLPLDAAMRAQLLALAKPYPKRGRSAENGTAGTTSRGRCDSDPSAPPPGGTS